MKALSPLLFSFTVQVVICAVLTVGALGFGWIVAYSICLGAALYMLPNLYFTYYAFRYRGSELTSWIRQSFMFGEFGKLSLTAVGFALVFTYIRPLHIGALFTGFVVMIFSQWRLAKKIADSVAANKPNRGG
jgi:ATP synthase protein I